MNIPTVDTPAVEALDVGYTVEAARLLDRVSLRAQRGEMIGLVGPNGAGKSTLLRCLSGLLQGQEGAVSITGRELAEMSSREVARTLALVQQLAPYTYGFTSMEVVLMGRYPHLGQLQIEGSGDRRIARDAMRQTDVEQFAERPVSTLSSGERQRVFVARALAQEPRLLLLDEPTSNLDVLYQLKVLDLVRDLTGQGMSAVAAIHDLGLAARYCHRLVLLHRGRVVAQGPPEEVLTADNIEAAFGVQAVVYPDPLTGSLTVSLSGPAGERPSSVAQLRVHVVCGGGTGATALRLLRRAGFTVTAGPLGAGDTDRLAAEILGIEYVAVPAFGGIDDDAHRRHAAMVRTADWCVLCDTPFGTNNLRSLEALDSAPNLLAIEDSPVSERDFTGGRARRLYDALAPAGRYRTPLEAVEALQELAQAGSER